MRRLLLAFLFAAGCNGGENGGDPGDFETRLRAIDGLEVIELQTSHPGYRCFEMHYRQPVNHDAPGTPFAQRMTLLHRDEAAPVVFSTLGYGTSGSDFRTELTILLEANELEVEHRFFGTSRPSPADWTMLTIRQAAGDHHR